MDDALVSLTGEDALTWLQGQVTQDLRGWEVGAARDMCLCKPTGQLLAVLHGFRQHDRFLLSMDRACVSRFMQRVEDMVIMEEVEASLLPLKCVSAQGPIASEAVASGIRIPHDRSGRGGFDFWGEVGVSFVEDSVSEIVRVEAGVPQYSVDWHDKTLPPELGPDFEGKTISYAKGCYTGQEVLMRIHSRGHTNRCLVGFHSSTVVGRGAAVLLAGASVGEVTSAVWSPRFGHIGFVMVSNSALESDSLATADGVAIELASLPFVGVR